MITKLSPYLLSLIFFFTLFSCKKSSYENISTNTTNKNNDHLIFRYNESANITSLDPIFAKTQANIWVCNQLFNGLVQFDDSLILKPDIAKKWSISNDGKTYLFTLRNDAYFHQTAYFSRKSPVKASDFEYSFNRLLDDKIASPGRWILQHVSSFKALNDSVFKIQLHHPFPAFLGLLAMKYASVVPPEAFKNPNHNFRTQPIGTGPFQFKLWKENIKLVLRKNPNYYEKDLQGNPLPYLEAISIRFLPDKQSSFLEFIQGKIDFISGLDPSYKDEILTQKGFLNPKYKDVITMIKGPYLNTEYLGFKMDGENQAILDKRIRQAMNYGFDRQKMITYLRNTIGTPAIYGIIPKGLPTFNSIEGYNYNPEKAKNLIEDYKKENRNNVPKMILNTISSYSDIGEYLQKEWEKIGLHVQIETNPPATLVQAIATGKVSFFRASWIADYPDAENYLSLFYGNNFTPKGPNYTHFKNHVFDTLYQTSLLEGDSTKRHILYQKMNALLIEEAPIIPLYYDEAVQFTRSNVIGLTINPLNLLHLKSVKKQ